MYSSENKKTEKLYLTRQIIAYIGNKRALLDFIRNAIQDLGIKNGIFFDAFSGSGVVARLAKTMGFSVYANDWEFYSYIINQAYLEIHQEDLAHMFLDKGGIAKVLDELNQLENPREPYIGKYYAPETNDSDPHKERMFYSRANGLKIDAIREKINDWYPDWCPEKILLTALLVYEAATHTNTSGVFKAYHHGFGGHGKDALKRILAPVFLEEPVLFSKSAHEYKVFYEDVNQVIRKLDWEQITITYLDPPYNQHQYGSNYHLLNTIALWDKPEITNDFKIHGKAAIRKDWNKTRSAYCYKDSAIVSFKDLVQNIKSPVTMLSYNTEGIIPFDDLLNILKNQGRVSLYTNKYTKYKGGRQSIDRKVNNLEFLIILEKNKTHDQKADQAIAKLLLDKKLEVIKDLVLDTEGLRKEGWKKENNTYQKENKTLILEDYFLIDYQGNTDEIYKNLEKFTIDSKAREIELLFKLDPVKYKARILNSFKKITHTKYQDEFDSIYLLIKDVYLNEREFIKNSPGSKKKKSFIISECSYKYNGLCTLYN